MGVPDVSSESQSGGGHSRRVIFIDLARAVAVFLMVQGHTVSALLAPEYRSGRLYELVELTPETLTVTRVHPSGRTERFAFNPYWVRVLLAEGPQGSTDLRLASHGDELSLGRFLTDDERRDLSHALSGALAQARVAHS